MILFAVIPAQAEIRSQRRISAALDPRLRGDDEGMVRRLNSFWTAA
jgi:hypothetical protein